LTPVGRKETGKRIALDSPARLGLLFCSSPTLHFSRGHFLKSPKVVCELLKNTRTMSATPKIASLASRARFEFGKQGRRLPRIRNQTV